MKFVHIHMCVRYRKNIFDIFQEEFEENRQSPISDNFV